MSAAILIILCILYHTFPLIIAYLSSHHLMFSVVVEHPVEAMVLILDSNSNHVARASRKLSLFVGKNPI